MPSIEMEQMRAEFSGQEQELRGKFDEQLGVVANVLGGQYDEEKERQAQAPELPVLPQDASDDDKEAYLRSLLSGERFEKVYSIFGGAVELAFITRLINENTVIKQLAAGKTNVEYERMQMAASTAYIKVRGKATISRSALVSISEATGLPLFDFTTYDRMDDVLYCSILEAFRSFENICDVFFKNYNNAPFWTLTAGATSRLGRI